jgi:proton glutamate symport protein
MTSPKSSLAIKIGISMGLAVVVGLILYFTGYNEWAEYIKPLGTVFIRLLKMIILPLVFSSVFVSIMNLGDPKQLTSIGKNAIIYYFMTTTVAIFIGLVLVASFKPGENSSLSNSVSSQTQMSSTTTTPNSAVEKAKKGEKSLVKVITGVLVNAIPTNPLGAMAEGKMLQVIVFAIICGLIGLLYKEEAGPVATFMVSMERMSQHLTHWVMKFAPIGIFALITNVIASVGMEALGDLMKYFLVVLLALIVHGSVLMVVAGYAAKKSPFYIVKNIISAMMTAFSTSSSAATLPVTMSCLIDNLKVREKTANFVLPLGATVNMDGTAIYVAVATVFVAQVYGIPLSFSQYFIILVTGSLASVGTAAVPSASLVTMGIVMGAVGVPLEGIQIVIAVDRILDMCRTTVNVMGDATGTLIVDRLDRRATNA